MGAEGDPGTQGAMGQPGQKVTQRLPMSINKYHTVGSLMLTGSKMTLLFFNTENNLWEPEKYTEKI